MTRERLRRAGPHYSRIGATTVEMALVLPILLTLVFGIMQVGYAFMVQHALQDAARKGCRTGTLPNRSNATVTATVNNTLATAGLTNTTITIQVNNVASNVAAAVNGDYVSVQVSMPLSNAILIPGFLSDTSKTLKGVVALRCQ